jgi:nucleoside-diphosphate-sugar epimerase
MKKILICGAGGFIGSHLAKHLKKEGAWVRGLDIKYPEFAQSATDEFIHGDLRDPVLCRDIIDTQYDEVYQLAADMGGAGFVFTGDNDSDIMHNSVLINLNVLDACRRKGVKRIFYSSSACVYPQQNQADPDNPLCTEDSAYPANPDSDYGWEKLFGERLFRAYARNHGLSVRVARYHNIFGPEGTWCGGREKVPAALCRKVAMLKDGDSLEMWGDGEQTRSFLYIDECLTATTLLMRSGFSGPLNIGSEEMVSINRLAAMILKLAGKRAEIRHVPGPEGVRGRNSDNRLIRQTLGWAPSRPLVEGLKQTYEWIQRQVAASSRAEKRTDV